MTESEAMARNLCPSPFADSVAHQFLNGATVKDLMAKYKLGSWEVGYLVAWVCETNLRRAK